MSLSPVRRLEDRPKVRFFKAFNRLFCTTFQTLTVQTPNRLPTTGPAIIVCNHMSGLDPLLLQASSKRVIVWMMAKEYYEIKSLRWFFEMIEAIPVSRDGRDSSATRAALRTLAQGNILGIFPEGRIEETRDLLPFQTGIALLAIKTGVPIYPAYLDGTCRGQEMLQAFRTPGRMHLRFGPELVIPRTDTSGKTLDAATEVIRVAIEDLKRQMALARRCEQGLKIR